jgi:FlaA1/EpsC-like NDP-sugar epimerase
MNVMDIAQAVSRDTSTKIVGIRPGEKLHEQMIGIEDAPFTFEYKHHFKILPMINNWFNSKDRIKEGVLVPSGFKYSSDNNVEWMAVKEVEDWIANNRT